MNFNIDFFEDEVRNGFPIVTMVKRGWAAAINVLEEVDRICKKYDIKYSAEWGTLLGTIRHQGFIPWDDDIDISMKRADYMRFLEVAPNELPDGYQIHNVFKQDMHGAAICGIMNTLNYCIDEEFLDNNHACTAAVGLDIFVYDYLPRDEKLQEQQAEALDFLVSLIAQYDGLDDKEKLHQLKLVEKSLGKKIDINNPNASVTFQLGNLLEEICMLYTDEDADELTNMMVWQHAKGYHFPKTYFDDMTTGTFEGFTLPIPKAYDEYLKICFGDYMKEVRTGSSHNYPYFHINYLMGYRDLGAIEYEPTSMLLPRKAGNNRKVGEKELIIFIVSEVKNWKYMEPTYNRVVEEKKDVADIYVMPLPYFYKNMWGEILEEHYDGNLFPDYLPLVDYEECNLASLRPDQLYFQDPYDEWHDVVQLPDEYKAEELWACSEQLLLVPSHQPTPFGIEDERATKMLFNMVRYPGYVLADRICIEDEALRQNYLDVLVAYAGDRTKGIWMSKLYL